MAIADIQNRIESTPRTKAGPGCEVCLILDSLSDSEAKAFRALLSDSTVRYSTLSEALRDDPDTQVDVTAYTLSRHARGNCSARERLR